MQYKWIVQNMFNNAQFIMNSATQWKKTTQWSSTHSTVQMNCDESFNFNSLVSLFFISHCCFLPTNQGLFSPEASPTTPDRSNNKNPLVLSNTNPSSSTWPNTNKALLINNVSLAGPSPSYAPMRPPSPDSLSLSFYSYETVPYIRNPESAEEIESATSLCSNAEELTRNRSLAQKTMDASPVGDALSVVLLGRFERYTYGPQVTT